MADTPRTSDWYDGLRAGISRYARWERNGAGRPAHQVVGEGAVTLAEALNRVDREQAKATANGTVTPCTIPVAEVIEALDLILALGVLAGDGDAAVLASLFDDLFQWRGHLAQAVVG